MGYKMGPRLRESRLLAPSGHGPRVHATYSLPYSSALKLTAVRISSLTAILLISVEFRNVLVNSAIPASFLSKEGEIRWTLFKIIWVILSMFHAAAVLWGVSGPLSTKNSATQCMCAVHCELTLREEGSSTEGIGYCDYLGTWPKWSQYPIRTLTSFTRW